jgi:hypothetical protein
LTARRVLFTGPRDNLSFPPFNDRLVVIVPLNKSVVVDAAATSWNVAAGETAAIPQNVSFAIHSADADSLFALHVVSTELALKDWR